MFTCCPECQTCFRITDEQLAIAKGLVRCGHCHKIFNGSENLTQTLPDDKPAEHANDSRHEADEHDSGIFAAEFSTTYNTGPDHQPIEDGSEDEPPSTEHFDLPSFSARDDFIEASPEDEDEVAPQDNSAINPADDTAATFDSLADDWFLQDNDRDTSQTQTGAQAEDTYKYTDISDSLKEEQNIEDIFSDMHQQLELGMAEPGKNEPGSGILDDDLVHSKTRAPKKDDPRVNDADEINQAIDSIFSDSELQLYGEKMEDQDYQVEKEMLAAFGKSARTDSSSDNIQFEDEAISLSGISRPLDEELPASPPGRVPEQDIPRRLRDSLAVAEPEKTSIWKIMAGLLLILLLCIALLAQLALFRNIEIVNQFPQTRPWLELFCHYVPCRIHAQRNIEQIKILERDIRAHPKDKKALLITATIVNKASFSQPYPDIRVTLSDLTGAVVAQRRFLPADYLGSLNSPFLLMKPGTPVHIRIAVLDPGRDAVNFEFQFL